MKTTTKKKTRSSKAKASKVSRKAANQTGSNKQKSQTRSTSKPSAKSPITPSISSPDRPSVVQGSDDSRVFTIEIDSIRAETTIGDLIVAYPKTRDVLMKHGLRFDVEEAGYLYMTLNVFSAIQGLALTGLLYELDVASKEPPLPPLAPTMRQVAPPPTS